MKRIVKTATLVFALTASGVAIAQQCTWSKAQCDAYAARIRAYAATAGSPESIAVLQQMHTQYNSCGCR